MLRYMSDVKQFSVEDTNRAFVGHCISTHVPLQMYLAVLRMQSIDNTHVTSMKPLLCEYRTDYGGVCLCRNGCAYNIYREDFNIEFTFQLMSFIVFLSVT